MAMNRAFWSFEFESLVLICYKDDHKMKKFKKIILVILLCFASFSAFAELKVLVGYNSQDPVIDTLRSQLFYYGETANFWQKWFFMHSSFYDKGLEFSISILKDHPELSYKLWLQPKPAPLVAILPGLGAYYTNSMAIAMAQTVYASGSSVFIISNSMNWEFMQSAATTLVPGYTPQDSRDTYYALYKIMSHLKNKYKEKITENDLVGYSVGGLLALFIAELDNKYKLLNFARIVSINPPVDLMYAFKKIDDFYSVADRWPEAKRKEKRGKAGTIYKMIVDKVMSQNSKMPFNVTEAKYLIGYVFHKTLAETIMFIHMHGRLGVIKTPYSWFFRNSIYREIDTFDYYKYIKLFALPYYSKRLGHKVTMKELDKKASLSAIADTLKKDKRIRVIHNVDDFLITKANQEWLEKVLGDRIIFFTKGGHMGNLYRKEVLEWITKDIGPKKD